MQSKGQEFCLYCETLAAEVLNWTGIGVRWAVVITINIIQPQFKVCISLVVYRLDAMWAIYSQATHEKHRSSTWLWYEMCHQPFYNWGTLNTTSQCFYQFFITFTGSTHRASKKRWENSVSMVSLLLNTISLAQTALEDWLIWKWRMVQSLCIELWPRFWDSRLIVMAAAGFVVKDVGRP